MSGSQNKWDLDENALPCQVMGASATETGFENPCTPVEWVLVGF